MLTGGTRKVMWSSVSTYRPLPAEAHVIGSMFMRYDAIIIGGSFAGLSAAIYYFNTLILRSCGWDWYTLGMNKQYQVHLTDPELTDLQQLIHRGTHSARVQTRARILLLAHAG